MGKYDKLFGNALQHGGLFMGKSSEKIGIFQEILMGENSSP